MPISANKIIRNSVRRHRSEIESQALLLDGGRCDVKDGREETARDIFLGALTIDDFINGLYNHLYEYINNIHSDIFECLNDRDCWESKNKRKIKEFIIASPSTAGRMFRRATRFVVGYTFRGYLTTQHKNPILMKNIFYRFMPPQLSSIESIGFSSRARNWRTEPQPATTLGQMGWQCRAHGPNSHQLAIAPIKNYTRI